MQVMSLKQVIDSRKGYLNLKQETKSTMTKESCRKTVLLPFESSESEKRNQLALIESQLFFNTVQNEETGEVTVPTNKLPDEVRFYFNCFDGDQGNRASTGSCSSAAPLKKVVIVFWPQRESAH